MGTSTVSERRVRRKMLSQFVLVAEMQSAI
jgi:hypothetical protein